MKTNLLFFFFLMTIDSLLWSQGTDLSVSINSYESFLEVSEKSNKVNNILLDISDCEEVKHFIDSGFTLSNFKNLKTFNLHNANQDSILESLFLIELRDLPSLKGLLLQSIYLHDFQGFINLEGLLLGNQVNLMNPSLSCFKNIFELMLKAGENTILDEDSEILEFENLRALYISNFHQKNIDFTLFSKFNNLRELGIEYTKIDSIPESWSVLNLNYLVIGPDASINFPLFFCSKQYSDSLFIGLSSSSFMDIPDCVLQNSTIKLELIIQGSFSNSTRKQLKKQKREFRKINKKGSKKNKDWNKKELIII